MLKPPDTRDRELAIELGLRRREGRRQRSLPSGGMLRMQRLSVRKLAKKYGVGVATIQKRLSEARATPTEIKELGRGLVMVLNSFRKQ